MPPLVLTPTRFEQVLKDGMEDQDLHMEHEEIVYLMQFIVARFGGYKLPTAFVVEKHLRNQSICAWHELGVPPAQIAARWGITAASVYCIVQSYKRRQQRAQRAATGTVEKVEWL